MVRRAHRHGVQPCPRQVADGGGVQQRRDQGQRAWPERLGQIHGAIVERRDAPGGLQPRDVGDHRVEPRPPLGREHGRNRPRVRRVAGQAIDGLGGQDDQLAAAQGRGGVINV